MDKNENKNINPEASEASPEKKEEKSDRKRFRFDWELEENLIEALDEDAMDLTEASEDEAEPIEIEGKSAVTLRQAAQTAFGLFLLIFAIIGVAATVIKAVHLVEAKKDNSELLAQYEDFILPLAAIDAPTFDSADALNEDVMISAACWDIIFNPSSFYEFSAGSYTVSSLDIDRRITKLFGAGHVYSHKTVGDTELQFDYSEETGMYRIPAYPRSQAYYPDVVSETETEDGGIEITVEYRQPIEIWMSADDHVEKTMIYTLTQTDTGYNVSAIRIGAIDSTEAN